MQNLGFLVFNVKIWVFGFLDQNLGFWFFRSKFGFIRLNLSKFWFYNVKICPNVGFLVFFSFKAKMIVKMLGLRSKLWV